jgi:type IV fimbrial biogenesis protein FimT
MIEMLVTLTILIVMAMLSVSAYQTLVTNSRLSGEISGMMNGLKLARSEAIKRGVAVDFCPNAGGGACGSSWAAGWNVMIDPSGPQVQVGTPPGSGDSVTLVGANATYPQFNQSGYTFFTGAIELVSTSGTKRCIIFTAGSWSAQRDASCP